MSTWYNDTTLRLVKEKQNFLYQLSKMSINSCSKKLVNYTGNMSIRTVIYEKRTTLINKRDDLL